MVLLSAFWIAAAPPILRRPDYFGPLGHVIDRRQSVLRYLDSCLGAVVTVLSSPSMKADTIVATVSPWAPMRGMNVEHFAADGIDPAIGTTLAGENQRVNAFIVDDGEFYILFVRSFDGQPPHNRTPRGSTSVSRTREAGKSFAGMFWDRAPPGLPEPVGRCRVSALKRCHAYLRLTIVEQRNGGIEPDQWRPNPTPGEGRQRLRRKNNRGYAILHGLAVRGWYPLVIAGGK
ncbi:hypothetical protein RHECIAT_CH0000129 [Rhizobium etli CIAT 652]|uniref:Uncharacterized protein n=1 Tax=Rhizobium etli (strain CIAT 652) TaxID=491916 RepID=B3PWQ7_RHIE6|nr:hypothetical protein RHECIAT_CH0000129 [Rhizobium etli CIAT 652]